MPISKMVTQLESKELEMKPKESEVSPPPQECQNCDKPSAKGEMVYDIGWVCQKCLDSAVNETGYCSMSCQLGRGCDGSC